MPYLFFVSRLSFIGAQARYGKSEIVSRLWQPLFK